MRLLLTALWLFPALATSQPAGGTYEHREQQGHFRIHRIQLQDSGEFIKSIGVAFSHGQYLSKGFFTENADTLTLHFEPYNRPVSRMEIIEKDTVKKSIGSSVERLRRDYLWLDISVCDVYGMKIYSWVSILSDGTELGRIFHPESRFFFQSENESVTELEIMSMGYKSYRMDLSEFRGSRAEIKITLISEEVDSYRQTPGLEKYVWRVRAKHLVEIKKDGTKGKEYSLILRE